MNRPSNASTNWRDTDVETLMSMKREGFTDEDIGEVLGRTAKAVSVRHSKVIKRYNGTGPQSHHTVLSDDWVDSIQEPDTRPVADDNYVICIPRKAVLVVLVAVLLAASWYSGKYL